ncbi:MAG: hypothetical protein ABWY68_05005 [Cryobacterium sp.]
MTTSYRRWTLWVLAVLATYVGAWAMLAPRHWWDTFPGAGFRWLPMLGTYNEHLARDVGALYAALAVLSAGAALRATDAHLSRLTGLVWLTFSIPHLIYHVAHLDHYQGIDKLGNAVSLSLFVLLGAFLVVPARAPVPTTVRR